MYRPDLYLAILVGVMFLSGIVLMIQLAVQQRRTRRRWSGAPGKQKE